MTILLTATGILTGIILVLATMALMAVVALTDIDQRRKEVQKRYAERIVQKARHTQMQML